ncbi:hypothetical protein PMAG_a3430 [Pseudoalteromonas mariniglutinosa NCIMB 1770]|nr:hypothetical protein [Pseudoalteromonas mariniglutinosa NCIMB 1770]
MLIPFVLSCGKGLRLQAPTFGAGVPQAMASRSLTPNFIKLRTLVRAIPL